MTRPDLIAHLGVLVADLLTAIPEGLSDEDAADLIAATLDGVLVWGAAPPGWSVALEALDGPMLRLLVLGLVRVGRRLPAALERAQERRERRVMARRQAEVTNA